MKDRTQNFEDYIKEVANDICNKDRNSKHNVKIKSFAKILNSEGFDIEQISYAIEEVYHVNKSWAKNFIETQVLI